MQTSQVYAVERVYEDLRTPQVAKDVLKQLAQLDTVVGDIFQRLLHRVAQEKDRITVIDGRISVCQAKVNAITARRTSNKPTTVFSTSKYPAPKVLPPPKTLFHDKPFSDTPVVVPDADDDTHFLPAEPLPPAQRGQIMAEVLELFEKVNPYRETQRAEVDMAKEGLGRLPEDVPSIGSLLLFNSSENPYQKYTTWDNLDGIDYEEEEEKQKELAKAPKTLVEGDELPHVMGLNYDYHPSLRPHEEWSKKLPTNLPLENIADYNYATDTAMASIAPSLFQKGGAGLPDLPDVAGFAEGPSALEPSQEFQVGPTDGPPPPPPPPPAIDFTNKDDLPPPPPPPPSGFDDDSAPPPPPPPMPTGDDDDAPPPPPPPADGGDGPPEPPAPAEPVNPVASLLEQIRNPKIKLRKVDPNAKADPLESVLNNSSNNNSNKPLSIAEEMKQRMLRRQAAISGKQDQLEQKRDREKFAQVQVLTAKEVKAPAPPPPPPSSDQPAPPPPPPPRNRLPSVDMSDDGSVDGRRGNDSDGDRHSDEGENDLLAQIRNIKKKQEQDPKTASPAKPKAPIPPPPKSEEKPNPVANFETQMIGLRQRADSLSMSEASDWSDD